MSMYEAVVLRMILAKNQSGILKHRKYKSYLKYEAIVNRYYSSVAVLQEQKKKKNKKVLLGDSGPQTHT